MSNRAEFIKIIQQNSGIIYKASSLYTNNLQDKEDLTQEIIYQLWKSFDSFQNNSNINTWIYRVAMNVAIHYFKKSKKSVQTIPLNHLNIDSSNTENEEEQEKWDKIKRQIENLNLLERGIILLYLEGKSYREIAEITGITESNVGTKMQRIKVKLKDRISKSKES